MHAGPSQQEEGCCMGMFSFVSLCVHGYHAVAYHGTMVVDDAMDSLKHSSLSLAMHFDSQPLVAYERNTTGFCRCDHAE